MTPARGKLLLRRVTTEETLPGGRILLPVGVRDELTSDQMEVLAIGAAPICKNEDCERPHTALRGHAVPTEPGSWILVRQRSLVDAGQDGLYVCEQDDVLAVIEP